MQTARLTLLPDQALTSARAHAQWSATHWYTIQLLTQPMMALIFMPWPWHLTSWPSTWPNHVPNCTEVENPRRNSPKAIFRRKYIKCPLSTGLSLDPFGELASLSWTMLYLNSSCLRRSFLSACGVSTRQARENIRSKVPFNILCSLYTSFPSC